MPIVETMRTVKQKVCLMPPPSLQQLVQMERKAMHKIHCEMRAHKIKIIKIKHEIHTMRIFTNPLINLVLPLPLLKICPTPNYPMPVILAASIHAREITSIIMHHHHFHIHGMAPTMCHVKRVAIMHRI